jgi:hypothetical protein
VHLRTDHGLRNPPTIECGMGAEHCRKLNPPIRGHSQFEERATIRKDGRTSQLEDSLTHSVKEVQMFETISGFSARETGRNGNQSRDPGQWTLETLDVGHRSATLAAPLSPRGKLTGSQDSLAAYHEAVMNVLAWLTDHDPKHMVDQPFFMRASYWPDAC